MPDALQSLRSLMENKEQEKPKREIKGNHALMFDGTKIKVDGEEIELRSKGWGYLCTVAQSKSPKVVITALVTMAKRVVDEKKK